MTVTPFSNLALEMNSATNYATNPAVTVIALNSELTRGNESQLMQELLHRVKRESIVLDLSNVERVDAAGITALTTLYCSAVEAGTNFAIVAPSPHVREMLRLVGLELILVIGSRNASANAACPTCDETQFLSLSAA